MASYSPSQGYGDRWKDASGNWVKTCSILTTTPNPLAATVHDRMPVILMSDSYDLWLNPAMHDVAALSELLKPYDAKGMRLYPVSTRINHVANEGGSARALWNLWRLRTCCSRREFIARRFREKLQDWSAGWNT
jgi:putative SOS response-associated peptidase YedK